MCGLQQQRQELRELRSSLDEHKVRRLFRAWHSLKFYNLHLAQASQTIKQNSRLMTRKQVFAKWVSRLASNLQVKIFQAKRRSKIL